MIIYEYDIFVYDTNPFKIFKSDKEKIVLRFIKEFKTKVKIMYFLLYIYHFKIYLLIILTLTELVLDLKLALFFNPQGCREERTKYLTVLNCKFL